MAKTSVLSKRWKYLRDSFPTLDFGQTYFVGRDLQTRNGIYNRTLDFACFVHGTMLKYCKLMFHMQKFRIFASLAGLRGRN